MVDDVDIVVDIVVDIDVDSTVVKFPVSVVCCSVVISIVVEIVGSTEVSVPVDICALVEATCEDAMVDSDNDVAVVCSVEAITMLVENVAMFVVASSVVST
jgi:hypothetical protein